MSFMNVPILVLIFWLVLLFLGESEGVRGVSRQHSGLEDTGRYFSSNTLNTIANFSAYKDKLIRPCGYRIRQTNVKRAGLTGRKRSLLNRIVEIWSRKDHSKNTIFKALSFLREILLSENVEDDQTKRRRRDVMGENISHLELRNRINDVQFIITQHLLVEVSRNGKSFYGRKVEGINVSLFHFITVLLRNIP